MQKLRILDWSITGHTSRKASRRGPNTDRARNAGKQREKGAPGRRQAAGERRRKGAHRLSTAGGKREERTLRRRGNDAEAADFGLVNHGQKPPHGAPRRPGAARWGGPQVKSKQKVKSKQNGRREKAVTPYCTRRRGKRERRGRYFSSMRLPTRAPALWMTCSRDW